MESSQAFLTVGMIASQTGVATSTLRYYEREGILAPSARSPSGYRLYDRDALDRMKFIRAAQAVGFTLGDIRSLLELDGDMPCQDVQKLIERRLAEVEVRMADLKRMRATLSDAAERCRKSKKGCAVLADLRNGRSGKECS
ncbi:MAG: heavy metal-responsive transcriptional regulator [Phycisphaerae bacterium]